LGHDGQLDLAILDIEDGIRRIPLRKSSGVLIGLENRFSAADLGEKVLGLNGVVGFRAIDVLPVGSVPYVSPGASE
jgi:hypothetical protein